jgi:hypothetical protein
MMIHEIDPKYEEAYTIAVSASNLLDILIEEIKVGKADRAILYTGDVLRELCQLVKTLMK